MKKPRMTFELRVRYDPLYGCRWHYDFWTYNGFQLTIILLNIRIGFTFVKANYS